MITRRSLLGAAGTLVAAGKRKRRTTWPHMGWNQNLFPLLIVTGGPGFSGVFLYSPAPGPGNLVASDTSHGGTDPFGNAYLAGQTTYNLAGGAGTASSNQGGLLGFYTGPASGAGPWTLQSEIAGGGGSAGGLSVATSSFSLSRGGHTQFWLLPSGDTSGVLDTAAFTGALGAGGSIQLLPGTYYLNAQITVTGATLAGQDMATVVQANTTGAPYTGPLLAPGPKGVIRNLSVENSGSDAITVAGGVAEWWLTDLYFSGNAGRCVNMTLTGPAHGRIRGLRGAGGGAANGGGVWFNGGSGASVTAEINYSDIDIQGCTTFPVIQKSAVTDVNNVGPSNGSVTAASGVNAILVEGACQNCDLGQLDYGGSTTKAVLKLAALGGFSPTQIFAGPGVVQSGLVGVEVDDGTARCGFDRLWANKNQGDGWQWNGTGAFNTMHGCGGNGNNVAAGVAYDLDIASSAHVFVSGFSGVSGAVTANINITLAANHVTILTEPAGTTFAGNPQAGW